MTVTTASARPVAAGPSARDAGESFLELQVEAVQELTGSVGRSSLTRRMVAQDVLRGRTSSAARIGEAIADAVSHGADRVRVLAVGERVSGWFRRLVRTSPVSLIEAFDRETHEQAAADCAQRRAFASQDPAVIARAIHETGEHVAAAQQLHDALVERHATLCARCG
jgi:hypothetical protein